MPVPIPTIKVPDGYFGKSPSPSPQMSPPDIPSEFSTASAAGTRANGKTSFLGISDGYSTSPETSTFANSSSGPGQSDTGKGLGIDIGDHPIIPPSHPARTLVLCFDGTGDQFDADVSNSTFFLSNGH